jgi:hypothetical protein
MSKYILKDFPDSSALLFDYQSAADRDVPWMNSHLHTPWSFSYFPDIPAMFRQAAEENIALLGINDFFSAEGYKEFYSESLRHRIFPMFNIEIVGLMLQEQYDRFRINDPLNPGRTYLSGKGLDYPFHLDEEHACKLQKSRYESQVYAKETAESASRILQKVEGGLKLKFSEIKRKFARNYVTERHISRAIRTRITEQFPDTDRQKEVLSEIFSTSKCTADVNDHAGIENEIRSRFLKSGGRAFVAEDQAAFLPVSEVIPIILNAGGIPSYSVLLDNEQGHCTEYEANKQILLNELLDKNIHCIEFIPSKNHPDILKDYARYFRDQGFLVLFGTAHSTPDEQPLRVCTRDRKPLDKELCEISYESCSVIAAHQYLRARGEKGYLDDLGIPQKNRFDEFISLGKAVIYRFTHL